MNAANAEQPFFITGDSYAGKHIPSIGELSGKIAMPALLIRC